MSRLENRWAKTRIAPLGFAAADAIAPALEKWLEEHGVGFFPGDMAIIAEEVIGQIAEEKRLYHAFHRAEAERKKREGRVGREVAKAPHRHRRARRPRSQTV